MTNLLVIKEWMVSIYQKISMVVKPVLRFIFSFIVLWCISDNIGYDTRLTGTGLLLALSLLCAFTPCSILVLIAAALSVIHVYYVSKILSVIVIVILLVLYLLFARFAPKQGYVMLAVPILFLFKMPYVLPLLLGLVYTPLAILPMVSGIAVYYLFEVVRDAATLSVNNSMEDILALYKYVMDALLSNKMMFLTMVIFTFVLVVVYLIRRLSADHAFYIAIGTGAVLTILGFLLGGLWFDIAGLETELILGTVLAVVITVVVQFFRLTLDYSAVERTQFEDDDYYYYVKAVPKMKLAAPEKNVKRINAQSPGTNTADLGQTLRDLELPPSIFEVEQKERDYGDD